MGRWAKFVVAWGLIIGGLVAAYAYDRAGLMGNRAEYVLVFMVTLILVSKLYQRDRVRKGARPERVRDIKDS